jgi:hypothetical protein
VHTEFWSGSFRGRDLRPRHRIESNIKQIFKKPVLKTRVKLNEIINYICMCVITDRLCGLVVRVLGYRSGGPGSIPGTTRGKKKSSGPGTESTQPREYD